MSRISEVIKNKDKIAKLDRQRRQNDLNSLRSDAAYKARLSEDLKMVNLILNDPDVDAVAVKVPNKYLPNFSRAIYAEDLAEYDINQLEEDDANTFVIRRKVLVF